MLHILATLVSMLIVAGAGAVIVEALADRRDAIATALGFGSFRSTPVAVSARARVRWQPAAMRMRPAPRLRNAA